MGNEPMTAEEKYLAYLTGAYSGDLPKPYTKKEKYLYNLCQNGTGGSSPEEIEAIIREYLEKNPIEAGATAEQVQQIEDNRESIAIVESDVADIKTNLIGADELIGHDEPVVAYSELGNGMVTATLKGKWDNIVASLFYGNIMLTNINFPENVLKIGKNSFYGCENLKLSKLPDALESVEALAFYDCKNIEISELPNIKTLGGQSFSKCSKLLLSKLPETLTNIPDSAFSVCKKITIEEVPAKVTSIGSSAFSGCVNIEKFKIHENISTIGSNALNGCTKLKNVEFKGTPNSIGMNIFLSCTNLTEIKVPWSEGEVAGAPWGATNATITYDYNK